LRETPDPQTLLNWYDTHARDMPWRVPPADKQAGVAPDPYRVWLSEIMLQQTTVAAVRDYFVKFTTLWPDVFALAAAEDADVMGAWAGLGYYARARNLLKCARRCKPCPASGLIRLPPSPPSRLTDKRPWWTEMSSASCRGSTPSRSLCPHQSPS